MVDLKIPVWFQSSPVQSRFCSIPACAQGPTCRAVQLSFQCNYNYIGQIHSYVQWGTDKTVDCSAFMDVIIIITAGIIIIVLTLLKEQLGDKTLLFFTSTLCYIKLPKWPYWWLITTKCWHIFTSIASRKSNYSVFLKHNICQTQKNVVNKWLWKGRKSVFK